MLPNRLDRSASGSIVNELVEVLGKARTIKVLDVDEPRFKFLANGRGCLSNPQLDRITAKTGIAWQKWGIDAFVRHATDPESKQLLVATRKMWDEIDSRTMPWPTSAPARRPQVPALRNAV
jgi:hypothetical protein